jgi:hypothetical protein
MHPLLVIIPVKYESHPIKTVGGDSFRARQVDFSRFSRNNALIDLTPDLDEIGHDANQQSCSTH